MRSFALLLACMLLASCSMIGLGDPPKRLEVVEYGIYKNGALAKTTTGVPRDPGVSFGMRVRVKDGKEGPADPLKARVVTATPGLIEPGAEKPRNEYVSEVTLSPGQTFDVIFTASQPWELVSGHWELRVETAEGEVLAREFELYTPSN
ncbi:hypothetical protein NNJEOMEG_01214 [Fundidesulfovibrio magnetotacticus]|uniref:DUF3859 domain-containing protein n=1 Tax=Fundidesulfovibrio magnetotacticus TaxID=2730080 RepID=A0A6V8LL05_9BACT|nr:DUF3859 domain-containing protein [Fundidesulfovibrio magnetotacticus]GFK93382.1 hypothetical protein NNJEOMEG_01214 [Fundidesulfovibrio magnetotacticus]